MVQPPLGSISTSTDPPPASETPVGNASHLEAWHVELVGGSTHFNGGVSGDLNGPPGVPD